MRWKDSVVVITGASRGIGEALAREAGARGARLGLIARSKGELDEVLAASRGNGAVAEADVSDRASLEGALGALVNELGPVDILVNNAGIGSYGFVADTPVEDFERMIRVNYFGTVYATKFVLPSMLERARGHIVNMGSIAGRIGAPLEAAYSASKFAVAGFHEALSLELANRGIGMTMIDPGPVETNFFEARSAPYVRTKPKPVSPGEVARAVISAVEKGREEVFIPAWLRVPAAIKMVVPRMFRRGTLRDFRKDLA